MDIKVGKKFKFILPEIETFSGKIIILSTEELRKVYVIEDLRYPHVMIKVSKNIENPKLESIENITHIIVKEFPGLLIKSSSIKLLEDIREDSIKNILED